MSVTPVILCGGGGLRLWPVSRPDRPKQFAPLVGPLSSFQTTARRLAPLAGPDGLWVVAGRAHETQALDQLDALGLSATLLIEPEGRDSAAAMAAAALAVSSTRPDAVVAFIAADHHVADDAAFAAAVKEAADFSRSRNMIVTLGITPTAPATAYGYIDPAPALSGPRPVRRCVEKPESEAARRLVAEGCLWNSGNFVAPARLLLDELGRHSPATVEAARAGLAVAEVGSGVRRIGKPFCGAPRISIDYAVMERTDRIAVLPVSFAWSDLGAWDAIWESLPRDADGNSGGPNTVFESSARVLVHAPLGRRVAVVGARDLAIVAEGSDILVCNLAQAQEVKSAAARLGAQPAATFRDLEEARRALRLWLDTAALPLWATLGVDVAGWGFYETLDFQGRPKQEPRRLRVQARQSTVYAWAGQAGWSGPWAETALRGHAAILAHYRRPDGLFSFSVDAQGAGVDARAFLYEQSFVLLHLAALQCALPGRGEFAAMAEALRAALQAFETADGSFIETDTPGRVTNPHMHLFEAALAWAEILPPEQARPWEALADRLADLALSRAIDPRLGAIYEAYDAGWKKPATDAEIWPGHQFEWAWLLARWARRRDDDGAMSVAYRLFEAGQRGVDPRRCAVVGAVDAADEVRDPIARVWPQTERLKAALAFGDSEIALQAANVLWGYLDAPVRGLWRERSAADGTFLVEPAPASTFYHVAGAVLTLYGEAPLIGARDISRS